MTQETDFAQLPISALRPLVGEESADFAVFLPGRADEPPVLYRRAGSEVALPDFQRLTAHGMSAMFVRTEDLAKCERILEAKLSEVVRRDDIPPNEKSHLIFHVGRAVAADFSRASVDQAGKGDLRRATAVVDNIITSVLSDPLVAANLLQMSEHELCTASHMFAVSALAIMLGARVVGSDAQVLKDLGLAGMMHDLGKLTIPPSLLSKTDLLSYEELQLIHRHPIESVRLMGDDPQANTAVRQAILQHHERMDGKGYPLGLGEGDLLLHSRILTVVDSFHAMIGRRVYRRAMTAFEANRCLQVQSGRQFDAGILKCWSRLFEEQWTQACGPPSLMVAQSETAHSSRFEHVAASSAPASFGDRPARHSCAGRLSVTCIYAGRLGHLDVPLEEFPAVVSDVSTRGACLSLSHPVYRGEVLHIRLQYLASDYWVRGAVAWCRVGPGQSFKVGVRFLERISAADAKGLAIVCATSELESNVNTERKDGMAEQLKKDNAGAGDAAASREAHGQLLARLSSATSIPREDEPAVVALASSPDPEIRKGAISLLVLITRRDARQALLSLLRDENEGVRERTAAVIGAMRMQDAANALRPLLKDPVESVSLAATVSLAKLGDAPAIAKLIEILHSEKPTAKLAARALGEAVGHRFAANAEGVLSARRYVQSSPKLRNTGKVPATA